MTEMEISEIDTPTEMIAAPPRPSRLLISVSLLNMAIGGITAGVGAVGVELVWPTSPFTAIFIGTFLFGLVTIIAQYLGTFHGSRFGAGAALSGGFLCCKYLFIAGVISPFLLALGGPGQFPEPPSFSHAAAILALAGIVGLTIAGFNWWWISKLNAYVKACPERPRLSFSLREILAFCILVAIIIAPATYRAHTNPSLYLSDVSAADVPLSLPDEAQHIDYQRTRHDISRAKFQIAEAPLRKWLNANKRGDGLRIQEFAKPVDVDLPERTQTLLGTTHSVAKGFRAIWNGDHVYYFLVYDRPQSTAYYFELAYLDED